MSPYNFSIKYIPGSKNTVADALSRQSFIKDHVSQRLLEESYEALLDESQQVLLGAVQEAFRVSTNHQGVKCPLSSENLEQLSLISDEVSAVLAGHAEWEHGSRNRAVVWLAQDLEALVPPGQDTLPVFSLKELQDKQRSDATLSQVISFVTRGRRPSRRERELGCL